MMSRRDLGKYLLGSISAGALVPSGLLAREFAIEPPPPLGPMPYVRLAEVWAIAFKNIPVVQINREITAHFGRPFPLEFVGDVDEIGRIRTIIRPFKDYVDARLPNGKSNIMRCIDGDLFVWRGCDWEKMGPPE